MSTDLTTKISDFKTEIMSSYNKELTNFFMNNEKEKLKFMSGIIYAINKIPSLLNDKSSLISAVLELAQIGMAPGISGEAYILPYKGKATATIGYKGYVTLLYQAGVNSIYGEIVRKNDKFKNIMGSDPKIEHEINPNSSLKERGEAIGVYIVVKVNGEKIHKFMSKDEIFRFRDKSSSFKAKDNSSSPWLENNDPELNMRKKTVLFQISKYLPKTEKLNKAVELDDKLAPYNESKVVITGGEEDKKKLDAIFENLESNQTENDTK